MSAKAIFSLSYSFRQTAWLVIWAGESWSAVLPHVCLTFCHVWICAKYHIKLSTDLDKPVYMKQEIQSIRPHLRLFLTNSRNCSIVRLCSIYSRWMNITLCTCEILIAELCPSAVRSYVIRCILRASSCSLHTIRLTVSLNQLYRLRYRQLLSRC